MGNLFIRNNKSSEEKLLELLATQFRQKYSIPKPMTVRASNKIRRDIYVTRMGEVNKEEVVMQVMFMVNSWSYETDKGEYKTHKTYKYLDDNVYYMTSVTAGTREQELTKGWGKKVKVIINKFINDIITAFLDSKQTLYATFPNPYLNDFTVEIKNIDEINKTASDQALLSQLKIAGYHNAVQLRL